MIHFAGLKAVGESVAKPWLYYSNNLIGTLNLLEFMGKYGCKKVHSSAHFPMDSQLAASQPLRFPHIEKQRYVSFFFFS